MKIFAVLPVSIVLVGILFSPMVGAAPPIPDYVQIVAPDPSLPKELSVFFGKYEGYNNPFTLFVIVARIDKEKATLYIWRDSTAGTHFARYNGWETIEAQVFKERGEYQLWYRSSKGWTEGNSEARVDGKYLKLSSSNGTIRLSRVP